MRVITFDVEHGSNHLIRTPSDQIIMIDAGNTDTFSPAAFIRYNWGITNLRWLTITHHDADHLADISNVERYLHVHTLHTPDVNVAQLQQLYSAGFSPALEEFLQFRQRFNIPAPEMHDPSYDWGGIQFATFENDYSDFDNPRPNNLSVVTFARYMGWVFIFPGDLERAGWLKLLEIPAFREWLTRVDIFIASHHGREAGYCEEVFTYCRRARLIIISDKSHPDVSYPDLYRSHSQGLSVRNSTGVSETRYVLTTRSDGAISIHLDPQGRYDVTIST